MINKYFFLLLRNSKFGKEAEYNKKKNLNSIFFYFILFIVFSIMLKTNYKILIIFLICLMLLVLYNQENRDINEISKKISKFINMKQDSSVKIQEKVIKNIIFDLGANKGDSALLFADPDFECKTKCHELKGICSKYNKKWLMYSFEANPVFNYRLDNVSKKVQRHGHTHYLYKESAAWTKNENITFYIGHHPNAWGSSAHNSNLKTKIVVKGYDISEIIDQYSIDDYIVVKIDIEGTEFSLFEHFLEQGTIKKIDYITIEFHNIYKNQTYADKIKFYETYLKSVNKSYSQWYLGHGPRKLGF
jgi:FkbM family methyltransferase